MRSVYLRLRLAVLLSLLVIPLVSCQDERDAAFTPLIPVRHPNREVSLSLLTNPSDISADSSIHLLLENRSQNRLSFPVDFGARIFIYPDEDLKWGEVENGITYLRQDQPIILASKGDVPFNQTIVSVWPLLPKTVEAAYLRILVLGNVISGETVTNQQVVAFIEIELQP